MIPTTMRVCLSGHLVNAFENVATSSPAHCKACGAKTITNCQQCDAPITWLMPHMPVSTLRARQKAIDEGRQVPVFRPTVPIHCEACGCPHPWRPTVKGAREKHQKFGILDAPGLLGTDIAATTSTLGLAVLYLDIDSFKAFNEKYTERLVDKTMLPEFQQALADCVAGKGYAYAEGGDEVIVLLPSCGERMACGFAEDLRTRLEAQVFRIGESEASVTVSIGVAHGMPEDGAALPDRANKAKHHAKHAGKNRTALWTDQGPRLLGEP